MDTDDVRRRLIVQVTAISVLILLVAIKEALLQYGSHFDKVPQHTSMLSGQDWINELISGHELLRLWIWVGHGKHGLSGQSHKLKLLAGLRKYCFFLKKYSRFLNLRNKKVVGGELELTFVHLHLSMYDMALLHMLRDRLCSTNR